MKPWSILFVLAPLFTVAAQNSLISGWSPASNQISFRILCPPDLTAGGPDQLFWVKCEIRNEGGHARVITNRARLFLTDKFGKTQRCLRRTFTPTSPSHADLDYSRVLEARQTNSWWESGQLKEPGRYGLHAVLDDPAIQTPPVRVIIAFSTNDNEQAARETALRKHFDHFAVVIPNVGKSAGAYRWMAFTNDPVVIEGGLYYAFRFKAPEEPLNLVWSFIQNCERPSPSWSWYIVPRKNSMRGFTDFHSVYGKDAVSGLTRSTDLTIFQDLPARNFEAGGEYCMWLSPQHGLPTGLLVSLNFSTDDYVDYHATPEAIHERNLHEPLAPGQADLPQVNPEPEPRGETQR
jgi:hypothetical protein